LSLNALGRLNEGIRLHRKLPNSKLVFSGHSSHGPTHAELLQQAAVLTGLDEESIILQKPPVTTYDEARIYSENYCNTHPVILVTSASHMPRAVQSFRFFDIEPVPSPTDFRLKGSWKGKWLGFPSTRNIENIRMAIKEYVGIFWYNYGVREVSQIRDE